MAIGRRPPWVGAVWALSDAVRGRSPSRRRRSPGTGPSGYACRSSCVGLGLWAAPWLLRGYGKLARSMLAPTGQAELALRVAHLAQTRADTIDTGAAEMRRSSGICATAPRPGWWRSA